MSDVFISYSRRDGEFVERLRPALEARSVDVWIDLEDIPPASLFADELRSAIEGANAFAFIMSPESLASVECGRELAHAVSINKRIIPVHARQCVVASMPETLTNLNFVPQVGLFDDDFERSADTLVGAITTDLDWVRTHTAIGQKSI
jgi:hypothetical protein